MTESKNTSKEIKEEETPEEFYTTIQAKKTLDTIKTKINSYSELFIKKPLKSGRNFAKELKADPITKLDKTYENTENYLNNFKTDSQNKYDLFKKEKKIFTGKLKKKPFKTLSDIVINAKQAASDKLKALKEDGSKVAKGLEGDLSIVADDIIDTGKNIIDEIPMKKSIEKKITGKIKSLPEKLNIVTKKEMKKLIKEIKVINNKIDKQNKPQPEA